MNKLLLVENPEMHNNVVRVTHTHFINESLKQGIVHLMNSTKIYNQKYLRIYYLWGEHDDWVHKKRHDVGLKNKKTLCWINATKAAVPSKFVNKSVNGCEKH